MLDPLHALAHHLLSTVDLVVGGLRRLGGLFGIACDIVHRGRHLVHRGGDLLGFFLLAADFQVGLFGDRRQRMRRSRQLFDPRLQAADNTAQARAHLLHGLHQLTNFVATPDLHLTGQVTGGNLLGHQDDTA